MNEFDLIQHFTREFNVAPSPFGPGDDCAVVRPQKTATCITTDALVDGVHFSRRTFSARDIGHKALAVNLSDLAAMGAKPSWALCALGLTTHETPNNIAEMARGMATLAKHHGVKLIGGNVTKSPVLSLTLTVGGQMPKGRQPLLRSTARAGDVLFLSGTVGDAAAGLHVLGNSKLRKQFPRLVAAQCRPSPHCAWALTAAPWATAAIDVSDGLLQDVGHLCDDSKVGAEIDSARIPVGDEALRVMKAMKLHNLALTGGEDYVLLVAVARRRAAAFVAHLKRHGFHAWPIGQLVARRGIYLDGRPVRGALGFQHFR